MIEARVERIQMRVHREPSARRAARQCQPWLAGVPVKATLCDKPLRDFRR